MKVEKLQQLSMLLVCVAVMVVATIQHDGKLFGYSPAEEAPEAVAEADPTQTQLPDGTLVINTTLLGKDIAGYAGAVPVEITIKDGVVVEVKALENTETPPFFERAVALLTAWNGKTIEEALAVEVDAVSGATFSSRAIIDNVRAGLQYAAQNPVAATATNPFSIKMIIGLLIVLAGAILPLFVKNTLYRYVQLGLNVVVLGFWCGTFLSYSSLLGLLAGGIHGCASLIPIIMVIAAFVYPLFGKKAHYCMHICPLGSLQELAHRCPSPKLNLSAEWTQALTLFRQGLWVVLMVLLLGGIWAAWIDYELFTAFVFQAAPVVVVVLAIVVVVLSVFVARPYCRFVCPTGTLFKMAENSK